MFPIPGPVEHEPDPKWLIELWLAIHGGDPSPEAIRGVVGQKLRPFVQGEARRREAADAGRGSRALFVCI